MRYDSARYARVNHLDPHHWDAVTRLLPALEGQRVLEVGCGRGFLLRLMQQAGAEAVGIDANPQAVRTGVADDMCVGDAAALSFPDGAFDAVVSVHAIEHIPDLDGALAEMARVLRPGGRALLVYPAEPIQGLWAVPTALILHRNPFKARRVHCHKVTPARLRERVADLPLVELASQLRWRQWPQYASLLQRVAA